MAEVLTVQRREIRGKRRNRRLRAAGDIPAILYGHGGENVWIRVPIEQIKAAIRHGTRVVTLQGDVTENALIRAVQWDALGIDVLHVDFTRVSLDERIEVEVPLEVRGNAPGTHEGGSLHLVLHTVPIECPAMSVPEKIDVNVNTLHLGQAILLGDLHLPPGVVVKGDPHAVVVNCMAIIAVEEEEAKEAAEGDGTEPELIGRKAEEEESEE